MESDPEPVVADPTAVEIRSADPRSEQVAALLDAHLDLSRRTTPASFSYALEAEQLDDDTVCFFGAWRDGVLVGVAALKRIDADEAELKSLHVRQSERRRGTGRAVVRHLLDLARREGYRRLSLETGTVEEYGPARALYRRCGFEPCGPFGDYRPSPYNTFMTFGLEDGPA